MKIQEKNVYNNSDSDDSYSNIVAVADCVITDITVRSGIAMVKPGEAVKKGQLLISGVIPADLGGGFIRADGDVCGTVNEELSVLVERKEQKKLYKQEELLKVDVKIFGFSINIFKRYGNSTDSCVIIEDTNECMIMGQYRLPIEIKKTYARKSYFQIFDYSDKELVSIASERLSMLREIKLSSSELVKIRNYGAFTDDGYKMTSIVTVLRDIGEEKFFAHQ